MTPLPNKATAITHMHGAYCTTHIPSLRSISTSTMYVVEAHERRYVQILHTKQAHTLGLAYHARYGSVVRAAPNLLAVNDPHLLPLIYHRRADKTMSIPPTQDWREHARKRKRVASSFSLSNLVKLEGQVDERVLEWTAAIGSLFADTGAKMDFAAWSQWFTYDTISQLSFGEPIGFVREARDVSNLIHDFHRMAPFAAVVGALPWLCAPILQSPITKWLFMPRPGDSSGTGKIMAFRDALLEDRLANPKAHHKGDFLNNILNAKNEDGSPISIEEVKTECFVLMVASADSTGAFFCGFLRYVLQTPGVYQRLLATPVATFDQIKQMPYLSACHKETLRFQPSTPMLIPRYVSADGLNLYGQHVPPGTEIGANPYVVHRDKGVFGEDADEFRPERWLEDPDKAQDTERYILTWGYGPRICLGKNIAILETNKLVLQFFRLFRPSIVDNKNVWRQANLALLVHWDMWINIEHRTLS
ncbi:cytochrome P450 monooxygenase [Xylaria telfairii]|nr:cytochrome P450 monooxygenase [Xylaria telfairii]